MHRESSLVGRVAWGSALAAAAAALIAALCTSLLAALLLQNAEDRRLSEAAQVLADELPGPSPTLPQIQEMVRHEQREMIHTGITFGVLNAQQQNIAGESYLTAPAPSECETRSDDALRVCAARVGTTTVLSAASHGMPTSLFISSALLAALVAGAMAWLASRPISRRLISPLSRLGARLEALEIEGRTPADLGPAEHVIEVDQLRSIIDQLLLRVSRSIEQAQRFAANAAHELRTPLTTLRAELELLREELPFGATGVPDMSRAEAKVAELSTLVERLLILATPKRAPDGLAELVSLRDLVEDAVLALPASERERAQTVEADAQVVGDAVLLGTLLSNALSNALKFGGAVHVNVLQTANEAVVHVDDDGPGLPESDRERVFEPFFRGSAAQQLRIPGHGLGLALIRHIAEAHGGRATFVDKAGRGARLEIRLPRAALP